MRESKADIPYDSIVLRMVGEHPIGAGERLYVPYQVVPMLHYYHPEIKTVGYDYGFPLTRLADGIEAGDSAGIMFCEASFCDGLERLEPGYAAQKTLLDRPGPNGQAMYLVQLRRLGSL